MKIAIVGYGIVGQATENTLKTKYLDNLIIHDPGKGRIGSYLDADLIFLCVPTDTVKSYLEDIPEEKHHDVIIRSTIDYRLLGDEFMSAGVWPEFLTERTWLEDSRKPICNILGGTLKQLEVLNEITIFDNFYHTKIKNNGSNESIYNTFYAMKVTFANMVKSNCLAITITNYKNGWRRMKEWQLIFTFKWSGSRRKIWVWWKVLSKKCANF